MEGVPEMMICERENCIEKIEDYIEDFYIENKIPTIKLCGKCIQVMFREYMDIKIFQGTP